jgi:hypothetical protein
MDLGLSSGHAEMALISCAGQGIFLFLPWLHLDAGRQPRSRLGPPGPTPEGLGLDGGRGRRHRVAAMGEQENGENREGIRVEGQRVVSRRVVKADMRGLVTAGPSVRLRA